MLAVDTGPERLESQFPVADGSRAVTSEAGSDFLVGRFPSHRFHQIVWPNPLTAHSNGEAAERRVIANQAFVETALVFEYKGLHPKSERIANRQGQRTRAVAHRVLTQ